MLVEKGTRSIILIIERCSRLGQWYIILSRKLGQSRCCFFWGWLENIQGYFIYPALRHLGMNFFLLVFVLFSTNDISVESIEMLCS